MFVTRGLALVTPYKRPLVRLGGHIRQTSKRKLVQSCHSYGSHLSTMYEGQLLMWHLTVGLAWKRSSRVSQEECSLSFMRPDRGKVLGSRRLVRDMERVS